MKDRQKQVKEYILNYLIMNNKEILNCIIECVNYCVTYQEVPIKSLYENQVLDIYKYLNKLQNNE